MVHKKFGLIALTAGWFLAVQGLGLWTGWWLLYLSPVFPQEVLPNYEPLDFLVYFLIAAALLFLVVVRWRWQWLVKVLLGGAILAGAVNVFVSFLPPAGALGAGFILTSLFFLSSAALIKNLSFSVAIAGVAAPFGLALEPGGAALILLVLSVYDVIATHYSSLMGRAAVNLAKARVFPGLILPLKLKDYLKTLPASEELLTKRPAERPVGLLGGGDLAFPLVFAVSVLAQGALVSALVVLGAVVGLVSLEVYLIFIRKKAGPLPALPALSFFSLLFYGVYQLIILF